MPRVTIAPYAIQYDGTNGNYIAGTWCTGISFVSDNGALFVYEAYDGNHEMAVGDWMVVSIPSSISPILFTDDDYTVRYFELVEVVPSVLKLAAGYALTPTILTTASANVAVDLDAAMTGTSYEFTAVLAGSASLLGGLEITGAVATNSDTVTVTVHNTGLVSLAGATVIVAAAQLV